MPKAKLLSIPFFTATSFLIAVLYAYVQSAGKLQPLFFFPTTILAGATICYLWKNFIRTPLLDFTFHAMAIGSIWTLYLLSPLASAWLHITSYICLAFLTLALVHHLGRRIHLPRKWGATLLVFYPTMIIVTLTTNDTQEPPDLQFGAVTEKINFETISIPHETYRYHTTKRTVPIPNGKLKSIILSVENTNQTPISAILETMGTDGQIRYTRAHKIQFDGITLKNETNHKTTDRELVIISNDSNPYNWDVFYYP